MQRPIIYDMKPYGNSLAPGFEDNLFNYRIYDVGAPLMPWKVKTNQYGWREPEYSIEKPEGVKRLMVLGDSVTYGMVVDYRLAHPSLLDYGLLLDKDNDWQVLNRSVPGWDGWSEFLYFTIDGYRWKPDVITINVVMNDFKPISDGERELQVKGKGLWERISYWLFSNSRFLNMARVLLQRSGSPNSPDQLDFYRIEVPPEDYGRFLKDKWWYIRGTYDSQDKEEEYQLANQISYPRYRKLYEECKLVGAYCLVVIYPTASQTSLRYWTRQSQDEEILNARPINELSAWLDQQGIPYINLLEVFREAQERPLFVDESHLTPYGHVVSARAVLEHLGQQNIVDLYAEPFWVIPD